MTKPTEAALRGGETRPPVETIEQAAAEISRLYVALGDVAVDLTSGYLKDRLAGEEGVSWVWYPQRAGGRRFPLFDPVMRHRGTLLLGAAYDGWQNVDDKYQLSMGILPGGDETSPEVVRARRTGRGYDPGEEYAATGDKVLRADYDHYASAPGVGADGKLAWSALRNRISDRFHEMTEVEPRLLDLIGKVQAFELTATNPIDLSGNADI